MTTRVAPTAVPAHSCAPPEWPADIPFLPGRAAMLQPMAKGTMVSWPLASLATVNERAQVAKLRDEAKSFNFAAMGSLMQQVLGALDGPMPEGARALVDEVMAELDAGFRAAGYVEEPIGAGMPATPAIVMRRYGRAGVSMAVVGSGAGGEVGVAVMVPVPAH